MQSGELDRAFALALHLGAWASDRMRRTTPALVTAKRDPGDVMTDVDVLVERHVRSAIEAAFPTHRVEGEELGPSGPPAAEHVWYVDPIDGTTNYAAGLPWSSFSLSLADGDGALLAVVVDPWRHETFSARRNRGSTLNGAGIRVRDTRSLAGSVILTELSGHEPWEGLAGMLTRLGEEYATTRILGSTALSLVAVAAGRSAATVLGTVDPIDDLAGLMIAKEAGAEVLVRPDRTPAVVVATPGVAGQLVELLSGHATETRTSRRSDPRAPNACPPTG